MFPATYKSRPVGPTVIPNSQCLGKNLHQSNQYSQFVKLVIAFSTFKITTPIYKLRLDIPVPPRFPDDITLHTHNIIGIISTLHLAKNQSEPASAASSLRYLTILRLAAEALWH
jgi:hypothetical protein